MSSINIEQPPTDLDAGLIAYLERLQIKINIALSQNQQLNKLNALPKNPQVGKLYYFNAAIAPDITGEGFWGYTSTGWTQL